MTKQPDEPEAAPQSSLTVTDISDVLKDSFKKYAAYVIGHRAVPDVRDGLKPVNRRLLYTAYEIGARAGRKHMKSAEVSGTCMGRYHPHGDAYGTLARMAQDFVMRHTLFDGQGNFGTLSDPPASSRYCAVYGTPIVLANGDNCAIEDLKPGDMVLTHRGRAMPVERLLPSTSEKVIEVLLFSGSRFKVSPNHPLLAYRQKKWMWIRARALRISDSLARLVDYRGDKTFTYADIIDPTKLTDNVDVCDAVNLKLPIKEDSKRLETMDIVELTEMKNPDKDNRTWDLQVKEDHTFLIGTSYNGNHVISHNTECRLTKFAEETFFTDLNEDIVPWHPNYAENRQEPEVLPAELPHLLLNGTSGIAVGLATDILSFNCRELIDCIVAEIDNKQLTGSVTPLKFFKGPDFPTGGVMERNEKILEDIWTIGRGSVKIRGAANVETDDATGRKRIIIANLPWQVNDAEFLQNVAQLISERGEDGKRVIEGVTDLRDESTDEGMRIVIELAPRTDPEIVLNLMYQKTRLQDSMSCGIIAIDEDKPRRFGVRDVLLRWLTFRRECVTKQLKREQRLLLERLELVDAYLKVHAHTDDVIKIIKANDNPQVILQKQYSLTVRQADAIVHMQLGKLRKIDLKELTDERAALAKRDAEITQTLKDPKLVDKLIKERLLKWREIVDERRTQVVDKFSMISTLDVIVKEDVVLSVNSKDEIKLTRLTDYRKTRRGATGVMESTGEEATDAPRFLVKVTTHDRLFVFTDAGRCHEVGGHELPITKRAGKNIPFSELFKEARPDEKIVQILALDPEKSSEDVTLVMLCSDGEMKRLHTEALVKHRGTSCDCFPLAEGAKLVSATLVGREDDVVVVTRNGLCRRWPVDCLRITKNRQCGGVGTPPAEEGDRLLLATRLGLEETLVTVSEKGFGVRISAPDICRKKGRGSGGNGLARCDEVTGKLVFAGVVKKNDELFLSTSGMKSVRFGVDDIRECGRGSKGVRLQRLEENEVVVAAACITVIED